MMAALGQILAGLVVALLALGWHGMEARAADSAVVLVYQRVGEEAKHPASSVSLAQFDEHVALLTSQGYSVIPLPEILARLDAREPLPDRTVALTFDNGFASVAREAWPRLKRLGLPFAVFIATDAIDAGGPDQMDWATLRAMAVEGVIIGTRGAANRPLWRLDDATRRADLTRAIERMKAELGAAPTLLAYPDGEYDSGVKEMARALGFEAAFALASGPAHPGSDRFALPRFELNAVYGETKRVALVAASLPLPISALSPFEMVLREPPARVRFTVDASVGPLESLACFQSNHGRLAHAIEAGRTIVIAPGAPFKRGHDNRINCTMATEDGRVRWLGLQYVMP